MNLPILTPSDFVAVFNQTLEYAYPAVNIVGEVCNYKLSKGKWVYFDIKDETASVKCFSSIYSIRLPISDGMTISLNARPQLHPLYNFSLQVTDVSPIGEGSIKKATDQLKDKLEKEGLFLQERKRPIKYPPTKIGLITSDESAAYGDFLKVLTKRWPLVEVFLYNTKVQGEDASSEIVSAIRYFNQKTDFDVLVITRGGGSADDLLAYQEEKLVRAIAESRIPTLVAVGHERDMSLAEMAADLRASTPSNAAELLAPEKDIAVAMLRERLKSSLKTSMGYIQNNQNDIKILREKLIRSKDQFFNGEASILDNKKNIIFAFDPLKVLKRGYSIVRSENGRAISSVKEVKSKDNLTIQFPDGDIKASVIG